MVNDRLHSFASKRMTKWSKRQLPGYWPALQFLAILGFGLFAVIHLLGGGSTEPGQATAGPGGVPAPGSSQEQPTTSGDPTVPAAEPSSDPTTDPTSTSSGPVPDDEGPTVELLGLSGVPVSVPEGATTVATNAFRGMFDPAVAATVPVAGGGNLTPPTQLFADATVGTLVVVSSEDGHVVFATTVDADGAGSTFSPTSASVSAVFDGSAWAVDMS